MPSTLLKALTLSLSLPLIVVALFTIYFAVGWTRPLDRDDFEYGYRLLSVVFIASWIASIPLSLALALLHRRSPLVAYIVGAPLVALSILSFIVATFGLAELIYIGTTLLSIPAWIALVIVLLLGIARKRPQAQTPARR